MGCLRFGKSVGVSDSLGNPSWVRACILYLVSLLPSAGSGVGGGPHHVTTTRQHHSAQRYRPQHHGVCRLGRVSITMKLTIRVPTETGKPGK